MADNTDIIKSFLVSLGFAVDQSGLKKFTGGLDQASKAALSTGKAVLGVAVAAETMVNLFSSHMEKLYFSSMRTKASVGNIQALELGFKQVGLAGGTATETLERMAALVRTNPGIKAMADGFLGKDTGKMDQAEAMLQLVEKMSSMPHFVGAKWAEQFGIDEKTFLMVKQGLPEIRAAQERMAAMNKSIGVDPEQAARDSHEYMTMWRDIKAKSDAVAQKWLSDVLPLARDFAKHIDHALDALAKFKPSEELSAIIKGWNRLFNSDKPLFSISKTPEKPPAAAVPKPALPAPAAPKPVPATPPASSNGLFANLEKQYNLPAGLLDKVWAKESGRGKYMRSPAGAQGHFGFMPATAKEYGLANPDDLTQSATAAARKWSDLLRQYKGDLARAAAAYNWGDGNLAKHGLNKAPFETRDYVASIAGVKVGAGGDAGKQVVINQKTDIHVAGGDSPSATGRQIAMVQDETNGNLVRNMRGAIQ